MANGTNYTKYASPSPSSFMGAEWGGKVRATHDTYTFASAPVATEVNVGVLMPGEVFLFGKIIGAALGSATTLQLGDSGDDDRYLAATVFTTAGQVTDCAKADGIGYKNETTSPIPIVLKVGVEEATGAVEVIILKVAPN